MIVKFIIPITVLIIISCASEIKETDDEVVTPNDKDAILGTWELVCNSNSQVDTVANNCNVHSFFYEFRDSIFYRSSDLDFIVSNDFKGWWNLNNGRITFKLDSESYPTYWDFTLRNDTIIVHTLTKHLFYKKL
ncbi:MAG: lipocalin family protein [Reichenbachiella sp.]